MKTNLNQLDNKIIYKISDIKYNYLKKQTKSIIQQFFFIKTCVYFEKYFNLILNQIILINFFIINFIIIIKKFFIF